MSDIAIKVENLSKSYLLGHNTAQTERYTALRDVIAQNTKNLARKTRDMFQGKAIVQGDEVEEFWALKDINFEIKQGDRVGIIGRNGAGKSTLLKILSRITEPSTGRIQINGRVASLLEVGTGFHPELSGRENIFLNGAVLGMSRREIQRKFDEIVNFAEVEKFLDTPVKRYSSGMYVRLAFAISAHLEPEILIVDEVLAVGDSSFQSKCLGKMNEVSKNGRTVLFVSHNISAIQTLCENAITLHSGRLVGLGPTEIEIANYLAEIAVSKSEKTPYQFNNSVTITKFSAEHLTLKSREKNSFNIIFESGELNSISDIALLMYSDTGARISVIDLKSKNGNYYINKNQSLEFNVHVDSMPFIEGCYDIGLYIQSSFYNGNVLNLLSIEISPINRIISTYHPSARGYVELNASSEFKIQGK